jgi:hypothetical protein
MAKSLLFALALLATISTTAITMTVDNVSAEKCEDIKGVEKWDAEGHDPKAHLQKSSKRCSAMIL